MLTEAYDGFACPSFVSLGVYEGKNIMSKKPNIFVGDIYTSNRFGSFKVV